MDEVKPATDAEVAEWFHVDEWNEDNPESQIDWYCSAGERVNPNTVKSLLLRIRADGVELDKLSTEVSHLRNVIVSGPHTGQVQPDGSLRLCPKIYDADTTCICWKSAALAPAIPQSAS